MDRYAVCFDGKWQGRFAELEDALQWGREVAETGRLVWVVKRRIILLSRLLAVFPEDRTEEGELAWSLRRGFGGGG